MKTVIFDLDGTLADTSGDLIAAANTCFRSLGYGDVLNVETDRATAVTGARAMLRLGFERLGQGGGAVEIERQFSRLVGFYAENIAVHTYLYPGARDGVERLLTANYAVGICTNKPEGLAEDLLRKLGVRDLFGSLIGADTLTCKKPEAAPLIAAVERAGGDMKQALIVGDTLTDVNTARAAGVPCLLVTFSPDGGGVSRHKPDGLLHDFSDIEQKVRALIG